MIDIIFKSMEYQLVDGNLKMSAVIDNQNKITLKNHKGMNEFVFLGSSKDMVKRIGEMLIAVANLAIYTGNIGPRV